MLRGEQGHGGAPRDYGERHEDERPFQRVEFRGKNAGIPPYLVKQVPVAAAFFLCDERIDEGSFCLSAISRK